MPFIKGAWHPPRIWDEHYFEEMDRLYCCKYLTCNMPPDKAIEPFYSCGYNLKKICNMYSPDNRVTGHREVPKPDWCPLKKEDE